LTLLDGSKRPLAKHKGKDVISVGLLGYVVRPLPQKPAAVDRGVGEV